MIDIEVGSLVESVEDRPYRRRSEIVMNVSVHGYQSVLTWQRRHLGLFSLDLRGLCRGDCILAGSQRRLHSPSAHIVTVDEAEVSLATSINLLVSI